MLFEFIFDDCILFDLLKVLIGWMQILMFKVVLFDKIFFSCGSYLVCCLFNEIVFVLLGWVEYNDVWCDSLYQKIEQVVMWLLNDFVDDLVIFVELLEDFIVFIGDECCCSEFFEQCICDVEEGCVKVELVWQDVEQVLNQ